MPGIALEGIRPAFMLFPAGFPRSFSLHIGKITERDNGYLAAPDSADMNKRKREEFLTARSKKSKKGRKQDRHSFSFFT
jgi:hypothetical protein